MVAEEEVWDNNSIKNNHATIRVVDPLMRKVFPETVQKDRYECLNRQQ
jgi:hypothetical protein